MKIMIPALFLAAASCISLTALPAAATEPPEAARAPAKADPKKMQPHSHLQEKTGIAPQQKPAKARRDDVKGDASAVPDATSAAPDEPKAAGAKGAQVKADKDKSKHFHPRDGK